MMNTKFTKEFIEKYRELVGNDAASISGGIAFEALDEIERLQDYEKWFKEWIDKTDFVQNIGDPGVFAGMHRADVCKIIIEDLQGQVEAYKNDLPLLEVTEKLRKAEEWIASMEKFLKRGFKLPEYSIHVVFQGNEYKNGLSDEIHKKVVRAENAVICDLVMSKIQNESEGE